MGLWTDVLRILGLSRHIRARVSARDLEVVITGDPEAVHRLVALVKYEIDRRSRWSESGVRKLEARAGRAAVPSNPNIVQPTELDDMDSPYAMLPKNLHREQTTDAARALAENETPRAAFSASDDDDGRETSNLDTGPIATSFGSQEMTLPDADPQAPSGEGAESRSSLSSSGEDRSR